MECENGSLVLIVRHGRARKVPLLLHLHVHGSTVLHPHHVLILLLDIGSHLSEELLLLVLLHPGLLLHCLPVSVNGIGVVKLGLASFRET